MRKLLVFVLTGILFFSFAGGVWAKEKNNDNRKGVGLAERLEEFFEVRAATGAAVIGRPARIINGVVTATGSSSLTVSANGKSFTVNVLSNTQLRRHFWGKASLSEISVNDKVNVWGRWADSNQTTINATLIRDNSIVKRAGVALGTITSASGNTIVAQTNKGVSWTVTTNTGTKFFNRKGQAITFGDLAVGNRIRIRGMLDFVNHTATEVTQVKDYSK